MSHTTSLRIATLLTLSAAPVLSAQTPEAEEDEPETSTVTGQLVDRSSLRPISGAIIRLRGPELEQITDEAGRFAFPDAPAGTHLFEVEHIAYGIQSDSLGIPGGRPITLQVRITASPIALEPLTVEVRSQVLVNSGFYDREERGFGSYLTREDIEQRYAPQLSMVLGTLPGVRLIPGGFGTNQVQMGRSGGRRCPVQYYLDGVPTLLGPIGIDEIPPGDVEGIEVYRGSSVIPAQFNRGNATCGVIVIWTRID